MKRVGFLVVIFALAAGPATQPAPQQRPVIGYQQVIKELPKKLWPIAGNKWDELTCEKANKWLAANVAGRTLTVTGEYSEEIEERNGTRARLTDAKFQANGFLFQPVSFYHMHDKDALEKQHQRQPITLRGKISAIEIEGSLHVSIRAVVDDCVVVKR